MIPVELLGPSTAALSAQRSAAQMDEVRRAAASPASVDKALEAGKAFEAYFVEMMVKEMRETVPDGLFSSQAMEMFSGLLDQEISKRIVERGGFGLQERIAESIRGAGRRPEVGPEGLRPMGGIPLPVIGRLTSRFGLRDDPFDGDTRHHKGLDIGAPQGAPIRPVMAGVVVSAGPRSGYGNAVEIDHGEGVTTLYAHCDTLLVRPGQEVVPGEPIATVGSTGRSTGPHLHFEARRHGEAIDPLWYFGWEP